MFHRLDPDRIVQTARLLEQRVAERFPEAGLRQVATDLVELCRRAGDEHTWLGRPIWPVRIAVVLCIGLLVLAVGATLVAVIGLPAEAGLTDVIQAIDAGVNEMVFVGIAIFFLSGLESRRKRVRALRAIHEFRAMAHIIDMHQLTKDPERVMYPEAGTDTASSPRRAFTVFELSRYLDYCSEMLSLLGKAGALYVQEFPDPPTLAAVNELTTLTNDLSRKIWQKIMILDRELGE